MTGYRQHRSVRLLLDAAGPDDVDALYAMTSDPKLWTHAPAERHTSPEQTARWIDRGLAYWARDGLSYWLARTASDGAVVGVGGVQRHGAHWNLYYRFAAAAQGHGYATELARAAVDAAHEHSPELPVLAWILAWNTASVRVVERLDFIGHGEHVDPSDGVSRLAFADRVLAPSFFD